MAQDDREVLFLEALKNNSRITNKELSSITGYSNARCTRTIKKYEGKIRYTISVDHDHFGFSTLAYTLMKISGEGLGDVSKAIAWISSKPNILEIHKLFGEWDFMVKIRSKSNNDLQKILESFGSSGFISDLQTHIVSETNKEDSTIDIKTLISY